METTPQIAKTHRLPGRDRKGTCGTCGATKRQNHVTQCRRYELADPTRTGEFYGIDGRVDFFSIRAALSRHP
jgi:hypothetical protein